MRSRPWSRGQARSSAVMGRGVLLPLPCGMVLATPQSHHHRCCWCWNADYCWLKCEDECA
uniref:Uncharacterized protein n=1 Tax=Setaria viridis TaxID=4556 RepID=A0A4U6T466_SETVI|nr:hypothetical protein SEVIR_9G363966v2 [Setaria viridis]